MRSERWKMAVDDLERIFDDDHERAKDLAETIVDFNRGLKTLPELLKLASDILAEIEKEDEDE